MGLSSETLEVLAEKVSILSDTIMHQGYGNVVRREVLLPNGRAAGYDIVVQKHLSVVIFVWDSRSSTTTLIKEYHPGPDRFIHGTVAGMYEPGKHRSVLEAAQHELEEEAGLATSHWYPLLESFDVQMPYDKYTNNIFIPFLALDCEPVSAPKPPDDEEYIVVVRDVSLPALMRMVQAGQVNVVSTYATLLGTQKLRELGIL